MSINFKLNFEKHKTSWIVQQVESTSKPMKPRQKRTLNDLMALSPEAAKDYIKSFNGRRSEIDHISSQRAQYRYFFDKLSIKPEKEVLLKLNKKYDPYEAKSPTFIPNGEAIGVEIECYIHLEQFFSASVIKNSSDRDILMEKARDMLRSVIMLRHIPNIGLKNDGSIHPENEDDQMHVTLEFTVLCSYSDRSNLVQLCNLLQEYKAKVNKSCGLHVHLDCRDLIPVDNEATLHLSHITPLIKRRIIQRGNRIGNALPILAAMMPSSRRVNTFCKLKVGLLVDTQDRYNSVNMAAIWRFRTIEVRLHSSTTNFIKISNWIDLIYMISRSSKMSRRPPVLKYNELIERLPEAPSILMSYVKDRIALFNDETNEESSTVDETVAA